MPISLTCRSCGETYSAPDSAAGRQLPCPICGTENRVPATSVHTTDLTNPERDSLRTVGHGLGLVMLSIAIYVVSVMYIMLVMFTQSFFLLDTLFVVTGLVGFVVPILHMVGMGLCLVVPTRSKAKGMVTTAFVLQLLATLITILTTIAAINRPFQNDPQPFTMIAGLMIIAGLVLFVLFLARTAEFIDRPKISSRAMMSMYLAIATFVLLFLTGMLGAAIGEVALLFGLIPLVVGIIALLRYVGSISQLRSAIREVA